MRLFSKTWRNDLDWLWCAIKSVRHYCRESVQWAIVGDHDCVEKLMEFKRDFHGATFQIAIHSAHDLFPEIEKWDGYMAQQWVKINAWKVPGYSHGVFWNWDSDCIAQRDFSSNDFLDAQTGRPVYWYSDLNALMADPSAGVLKAREWLLFKIFGNTAHREWMRCMPIAMKGQHLFDFAHSPHYDKARGYCMAGERTLSEFNVIGEFIWNTFREDFHFKDAESEGPTWAGDYCEDPAVAKICHQAWSWGGLPPNVRAHVQAL